MARPSAGPGRGGRGLQVLVDPVEHRSPPQAAVARPQHPMALIGEVQELGRHSQHLGVPTKFLYFPDEGHWVLRPRNRRLWWGTVLDWIDQYLKPAPPPTGAR